MTMVKFNIDMIINCNWLVIEKERLNLLVPTLIGMAKIDPRHLIW